MTDSCPPTHSIPGHAFSRRTLLRGTITLGAVAAVGGVELAAAPTAGAVPMPSIASCATWSAQAARSAVSINSYRPTKILIHHTASANSTDYSQSHAYAWAAASSSHTSTAAGSTPGSTSP